MGGSLFDSLTGGGDADEYEALVELTERDPPMLRIEVSELGGDMASPVKAVSVAWPFVTNLLEIDASRFIVLTTYFAFDVSGDNLGEAVTRLRRQAVGGLRIVPQGVSPAAGRPVIRRVRWVPSEQVMALLA